MQPFHPIWLVSATVLGQHAQLKCYWVNMHTAHQKHPDLIRNLVYTKWPEPAPPPLTTLLLFEGGRKGKPGKVERREKGTMTNGVLVWDTKGAVKSEEKECGSLQEHFPRALHWLLNWTVFINSTMIRPTVVTPSLYKSSSENTL